MSLFDDFAREIRRMGECYLLVDGARRRIVAADAIRIGGEGKVVAGRAIPKDAALYRLWNPHPRYRALAQALPDATDVELGRLAVDRLVAALG